MLSSSHKTLVLSQPCPNLIKNNLGLTFVAWVCLVCITPACAAQIIKREFVRNIFLSEHVLLTEDDAAAKSGHVYIHNI